MLRRILLVTGLTGLLFIAACGKTEEATATVDTNIEATIEDESVQMPEYVEEESSELDELEEETPVIRVLDAGYTGFRVMGENLIVTFTDDDVSVIDHEGNVVSNLSEYTDCGVTTMNNDDYLIIEKDGKYGIISTNNEVIVDFDYDYLQQMNGNIWDDNTFALVKKNEDSFENVLFDKTATPIITSSELGDDYKEFYFSGYHDGLLFLERDNYYPVYIDTEKILAKEEHSIIDLNKETWAECYGSQNYDGIITLKGSELAEIEDENRKGLNNYYIIDSEQVVSLNNTDNGDLLATQAFRCIEDGWMNGIVVDSNTLEWNGNWFFCNINSGEIIELDKKDNINDGYVIVQIETGRGVYVSTFNNYGFLSNGEGYLIVDLAKDGEIVNDVPYKNIYLENASEYALVEKNDGSWDLLDTSTMEPTGKYKDASAFSARGYALVSEDGMHYYLVDKELNKISDDYEGISGALYGYNLFALVQEDGTQKIIICEE